MTDINGREIKVGDYVAFSSGGKLLTGQVTKSTIWIGWKQEPTTTLTVRIPEKFRHKYRGVSYRCPWNPSKTVMVIPKELAVDTPKTA
jgi:hypothetical protein